jgi:hypothetical protein
MAAGRVNTNMRPLADLTPLPLSPSVFQQPQDDWNSIFADALTATDSNQSAVDGQIPSIYAAMDPISQAIDALGGLVDAGGAILDILSGDLDLVDLTPEILNYQAADTALDSGLSSFTIDVTAVAEAFISFLGQVIGPLIDSIIRIITDTIQAIETEIAGIIDEIKLLELQTVPSSQPPPF